MFPPAGAQIHRNEAGEVTGWDNPYYDEPDYDPYGSLHEDSYYGPDDWNDTTTEDETEYDHEEDYWKHSGNGE
jgi:hypothetical protein